MKIVIDVSEKVYNHFCRGCRFFDEVEEAIIAITDGTVLPEGHGRLIDADKLEYTCNSDECGMLTGCNHCQYHIITEDEVDNAETIIEADKESEGDHEL